MNNNVFMSFAFFKLFKDMNDVLYKDVNIEKKNIEKIDTSENLES